MIASVEETRGLGLAAHRDGKLDAARRSYRSVLSEMPGDAWCWHLLGVLRLQEEGGGVAGPAELTRALALDSEFVAAHLTLGDIAQRHGDRGLARRAFRRGAALAPGTEESQSLLASLDDQPLRHRRRAVALAASNGAVWCNLADAELNLANLARASAAVRRSLALSPDLAESHANHAGTLVGLEQWSEAGMAAKRALALFPLHGGARINLAASLRRQGRLVLARRHCRQAVAAAPDVASTMAETAATVLALGRANESVVINRRALAVADASRVGSNLVFALCYVPDVKPALILREARRQVPRSRAEKAPSRRTPEGSPIVVGYLSPDLARHPVGYFLLPVLRHHRASRFRSVCYSTRRVHDRLSEELRSAASTWVGAADLDDDALAARVTADGIDILVDLAGHTAGARLGVFARRPASVQATWAGFPGTTGASWIDYVIGDAVEIPPGAESGYSERPVRLPGSYVCYVPPDYAPSPGPLPAISAGSVSFGCFNNPAKFNDGVFRAWARILMMCPDSRLILRWHSFMDHAVADEFRLRLASCGLPPASVDIGGCSDHGQLLAAYRDIDVALDPFPYTGGLTTLEALWMGVPVVTLAGETFAGRHSASHLTAAGLEPWITSSVESYIATAIDWAGRLGELADLRSTLRSRLQRTTLIDGAAFTRNLEAAYEAMLRGDV